MIRSAALILSHNDAPTVGEAIVSMVQQSRVRDLRAIVLADDASTDDTAERAVRAAGDLPLTVLRAERNLGQWNNLNRALRYLSERADWVLLLHADDVVLPGWLDALLERVEGCADDVASISSSWDLLHGGHIQRTGERHEDPVRRIAGSPAAVHDTLLSGCWWKISGAALRMRAFHEVGPFDQAVPYCGDWDWLLRALDQGWTFEYLPRVYMHYRQHGTTVSATSLRDDIEIADAITVVDRYGQTLSRTELVAFHARRAWFVARRMGRGLLRRDVRRVATSLRTWRMLGRHLVRRLAS